MQQHTDCEQAQQLLSRLYGALDERDYAAVAQCFHEDGTWHRQGKVLHGRTDIVAALLQRSPTLVVHHLYSNCLFEVLAPGRLAVRYLLTVFQVEPGQPPIANLPSGTPQVGFCDAELRLDQGCWRLERMQARTPTFKA